MLKVWGCLRRTNHEEGKRTMDHQRINPRCTGPTKSYGGISVLTLTFQSEVRGGVLMRREQSLETHVARARCVSK